MVCYIFNTAKPTREAERTKRAWAATTSTVAATPPVANDLASANWMAVGSRTSTLVASTGVKIRPSMSTTITTRQARTELSATTERTPSGRASISTPVSTRTTLSCRMSKDYLAHRMLLQISAGNKTMISISPSLTTTREGISPILRTSSTSYEKV